jgi:exosome complex component RRP42
MPPAAASTSTTLSPAELSYLHTSLSHTPSLRPDLRSATEFRPLRAETELLPSCNGSAHVSLADGSEALVGVKAEVHRHAHRGSASNKRLDEEMDEKMSLDDESRSSGTAKSGRRRRRSRLRGSPDWIALNVDISTLRDDDALLVFLGEMLREPLLVSTSDASLADALVINGNWHWHLHIDVLLLSPFTASGTSYPLPLLSLATHLALRSTRLPKLKSQGEEDPLVDDDWESSEYLYQGQRDKGKAKDGEKGETPDDGGRSMLPPITLLVMTAGENIIFDPSHSELAVADAVFAVSVGFSVPDSNAPTIMAVRTIETPARDTMKGVPASGVAVEGEVIPGVWRPRVGGLKRDMLKRVIKAVVRGEGTVGQSVGVAREVLDGLEIFHVVGNRD